MAAIDARSTRAWRKLRDQVVDEEPDCRLQLPGCTGASETADHVLTVKERPDLALTRTNLRGACQACNKRRGDKPDGAPIAGGSRRPRALEIFTPLHLLAAEK